jgi:hypothetical protein
MTTSNRDYSNLGYTVTTRTISWEQMVREAEGSRWNLPVKIYDIEGRVFVQYNAAVTGPGQ